MQDPRSSGDAAAPEAQDAESPPARRVGRPRDSTLEERVYDAAMRVYAETGWAGFSIERVAKAAGVGKAAIYSRWSDKRDILRDTFDRRWQGIEDIDEGSLSGDLRALVAMAISRYRDTHGAVALHMQVDGQRFPEFREMALPFVTRTARPVLRMLGRAKERGEMDPSIRRGVAILLIMGPIVARFARLEASPSAMTGEDAEAFCNELAPLLERALAPVPTASDPAVG